MKVLLMLFVGVVILLVLIGGIALIESWLDMTPKPPKVQVTKREKALEALNGDANYIFSRLMSPPMELSGDMDILTEETRKKIHEWQTKNRKLT